MFKNIFNFISQNIVLYLFRKINVGNITFHVIDTDRRYVFGDIDSKLKSEIIVNDRSFFQDLLFRQGIGFAESYMDGKWESESLYNSLDILAKNPQLSINKRLTNFLLYIYIPIKYIYTKFKLYFQKDERNDIKKHYDLSNEMFSLFLDKSMAYSCAVFEPKDLSLYDASIEKLDRICRKLELKASDHVIEIGTGWGSFAVHAVKNYGCTITTTTISEEQFDYVTKLIEKENLKDKITLLKNDYRELTGQFDKLVSIEMIEAVGYNYIQKFFKVCSGLLKPDGLMAFQGITYHEQGFNNHLKTVDFIKKYIFPGSNLISVNHVLSTVKEFTDLSMVHFEDITKHYAETLRLWRENYISVLPSIKDMGFSDEFLRIWEYYFIYCEAGFRERYIGDVQIVMAKSNNKDIQIDY